jgi:D-arabinose 1-dehydrogenase-like Zn-dependent alcohol dehydrogenase
VPDEIPEDVATPINCALSQVLYGLRKAGFRAGQSLVVQGAGGLGINAVAVARDMGADRVIVIDRLAQRLALAKSFGADHIVNASEIASADKRVDAVKALTDGFGAHVVADFVGYADVIPEGLRMLRGGGCYLEVGSISPGNVFSYDATALVRANARLVATSNYSPWALEESLSFMKRNLKRFPFEKVISHVFPLERISRPSPRATGRSGGDPAGVSAPPSRCRRGRVLQGPRPRARPRNDGGAGDVAAVLLDEGLDRLERELVQMILFHG